MYIILVKNKKESFQFENKILSLFTNKLQQSGMCILKKTVLVRFFLYFVTSL
jgi:hypothetical protein